MTSSPLTCAFCLSKTAYAYVSNGYDLLYCERCGVIGVREPPSEEFLRDFYQGFSFQANPENLQKILTPEIKQWMTQLIPNKQGTMLDFGGGGGFFAKAFEEFNLGCASYVDVNGAACNFASSTLGLTSVYRGSGPEARAVVPRKGFDFIMCRHVIEHLTDPVSVVLQLADLLSENGVLVLLCPNGSSKEGLFYPGYWMKFLGPMAREMGWSRPRAIVFSLTRRYGWGISPPRHLWAITGDGMRSAVERDGGFLISVKTASLANSIYSPYWDSRKRSGRIRDRVCDKLFGSLFEGMHLIAEVRRRRG